MYLVNRRTLTAIGAAAVAVTAATTLFGAPAQAATVGRAEVVGARDTIVRFTAAGGQQNSLVITISGRVTTLDDRVAIKPGRGCKAVSGDRTKVRCTTTAKPTEYSISLGDRNDAVHNRTSSHLTVAGGAGNDILSGGSNRDRLFGEAGDDRIYGNGATDAVDGGDGHDRIFGGAGDDWLDGDDGHDIVHGGAGNDTIYGHFGNDDLRGESGNDTINGGPGNDRINGGAGKNRITA
ncbi:calcium-binding protein [Actinoplanes utahensis]|uniref:calcium-binding protein n=1 Tax=Actinoplanes utahensis TaxID=1869 RepID=UPI00068A54E4|nr:calcium-binding protein [Actinoplanes utahensis]